MKQLLYSGILYLIGVSIILVYRPSLMFTEDGIWKEFGIGRNPEQYTWLPFWLFAIIWAILSYIIVISLLGYQDDGCYTIIQQQQEQEFESNTKGNSLNKINFDNFNKKNNLKPGYYIKNKTGNNKSKYTFIGEEPPEILFNNTE